MSFYIVIDTLIAFFSMVASIIIAYTKWKSLSDKHFVEYVKQIVDDYMSAHLHEYIKKELESKEMQEVIEKAIDSSSLNKKIDKLILILCTNDDRLKNTTLCQGL